MAVQLVFGLGIALVDDEESGIADIYFQLSARMYEMLLFAKFSLVYKGTICVGLAADYGRMMAK